MARLFGTDGVRGVANAELTCELAFRLGQAGARVLASSVHRPTILVGRDTRISGEMLEAAMVAGVCAQGGRAVLLGVLPTPGIAYLTRLYEADAGVVISASHNAAPYNGIKFFDQNGRKLPDETEDQIELLLASEDFGTPPTGAAIGRPVRQMNAARQYIEHLKEGASRLDGLHVVVDCANGAASQIAPRVLDELGASINAFYHEPDGTNINENCGSTHPKRLQELVLELGADVGLALDGDADRLIAVDERGQIVDGDRMLAICAVHLKQAGRLGHNTLVTTVMSNMGLELCLKERGVDCVKTKVGDRYVLERMLEGGYTLGGEQSGHIIFLDRNTTGDGVATALELLGIMAREKRSLSALAKIMRPLPQATVNARVPEARKLDYAEDTEIAERLRALEAKYAGRGRTLIRPSGTEALVRVMLEGPDQRELDQDAYELAQLIERRMGT